MFFVSKKGFSPDFLNQQFLKDIYSLKSFDAQSSALRRYLTPTRLTFCGKLWGYEYCQLLLLIRAKFLLTGKIGGELFRLKNHSKWIELAIYLSFLLIKAKLLTLLKLFMIAFAGGIFSKFYFSSPNSTPDTLLLNSSRVHWGLFLVSFWAFCQLKWEIRRGHSELISEIICYKKMFNVPDAIRQDSKQL